MTTVTRWHSFLQDVQGRAEYRDEWEAENAARIVVALLGSHLLGSERTELAERLPLPYVPLLLDAPPAEGPISAERFVGTAATWIDGATPATARWDVCAVLSTVAEAAGPDLLRRLLLQLPEGYDQLFGRLPGRSDAQPA
ncbi:DUF2267 domain-containing protein [Kitasatospora sp. NPDC057223]|uniref:DUF2267 domain-containing protein n=1 Tax=Kitasatospora sp. NPDC057223 TaxID=3346055 RepID=UPI00362D4626